MRVNQNWTPPSCVAYRQKVKTPLGVCGKQSRTCDLLGCVDPDDIQMTVVDAFFILVGIASAALGSGLSAGSCGRQPRLGAAGYPETSGVVLGYNHGIANTLHWKRNVLEMCSWRQKRSECPSELPCKKKSPNILKNMTFERTENILAIVKYSQNES